MFDRLNMFFDRLRNDSARVSLSLSKGCRELGGFWIISEQLLNNMFHLSLIP